MCHLIVQKMCCQCVLMVHSYIVTFNYRVKNLNGAKHASKIIIPKSNKRL